MRPYLSIMPIKLSLCVFHNTFLVFFTQVKSLRTRHLALLEASSIASFSYAFNIYFFIKYFLFVFVKSRLWLILSVKETLPNNYAQYKEFFTSSLHGQLYITYK